MNGPDGSNGPLSIRLGDEAVTLWPARALSWPRGRILFVADTHFGKAAAFRAAGVAAPDGTDDDLARLDSVLAASGAERLVVLGDFFHARRGLTAGFLGRLSEWRARHPDLAVTLVRGNHDRNAGDPPGSLRIEVVAEPWPLGPWCCRHQPAMSDPEGRHTLAGHVHPGIALRDRNGAGLRAVCFVVDPTVTVLPAFGRFTGLELVEPRPDRRIFVVSDEADTVIEIPRRRADPRKARGQGMAGESGSTPRASVVKPTP